MIPKKIHFCWFGKNKKTEFINYCIRSWRFYLEDYEIIEWNESNFDIEASIFVRQAYNNSKWAFVSDYVRAFVLYHHGGIYLDTDVEIKCSLDSFLQHKAFSGFESIGYPFTAVWGSEKNHIWPKEILEYYNMKEKLDLITNTKIISKYLIEKYSVDPYSNLTQKLDDGIIIYPNYYFCTQVVNNYAIHHFTGTWLENNDIDQKENILKPFYKERFLNYYGGDILEIFYNEQLISKKELLRFLKKKLKKKIFNF